MKKVLIIHDYPHYEGGGIEVQCFLDAQELVKRGYSVTIASTRKTSETFSGSFVSSKNGVDFLVVKSKDELSELVDQFDIIHIQATFSLREGAISALQILNEKKRKHIISIHTNINHLYFGASSKKKKEETDKLLSEFTSFLSSPYATLVGVSQSLKESLRALGVSKKFTVIHNAKDWENFSPSENSEKISMADITYIGEISSMKGVHTLLSAIVLLKKEFPFVKVRLIGNGTSENECFALVRVLGLENNIEHIKYVENNLIPDYLVRTKILTLPSLTESWGNVVMEAMGLGTATVSSKVEGLIELAQNGNFGFLCSRGDAEDFARTFLKILKSEISLPCSLSEVKEFVTKNYSIKNRVDKLESIYFSSINDS